MAGTILPQAVETFVDANGKPLAGGSVYMYIPNTTTFKNTWQDPAQTILNTNPIILNASGQAIIWGTGSYRQQVFDVNNNLIWDQVTEDTTSGLLGNMTDDTFVAGTDFTPGTTTTLTLSVAPGGLANTWIYFDAAYQADNSIVSLNGATLTFNAPIPLGTQLVTVKIGSTIAIGTTSSLFVSYTQKGNNASATNVSAQLDTLSYSGIVRMIRASGSEGVSGWFVLNEFGNPIPTIGTTTSGLQEAINYAAMNGFSLHVIGGATSENPGGIDYGFINCSTPITFPSMRTCRLLFSGVHVIFSSAVTGPAVTFDSCMEVMFDARGSEWVYQGNASVIHFAPATAVPVDPQISIVDSEFQFGSVVANGGAPNYCVHFDCSSGPITDSKFSFAEINGNGAVGQPNVALYGVAVQVAAAGSGFVNNLIEVRHIHNPTNAGVQIGLSTSGQETIVGNQWKITSISPSTPSATGFNTYGNNDIVDIGVINSAVSAYSDGLHIQPGANNNFFRIGQIAGYTNLAVNSAGANNKVWTNGQFQDAKAGVNLNGNNQSIASGVWTKVQFNSKEYDVGNTFDTVNYRWTPGSAGYAEITANVSWNTVVAGDAFFVSIYRNGFAIKQTRFIPSATSGGQSIAITATMSVGVAEYFEIFVFQATGSNQTLDGAVVDTWADFKLLP